MAAARTSRKVVPVRFAGSDSEPGDRPSWRTRCCFGGRRAGQLNVARSNVHAIADIKLPAFDHSLVEVRVHAPGPLEEFPGLVLARYAQLRQSRQADRRARGRGREWNSG